MSPNAPGSADNRSPVSVKGQESRAANGYVKPAITACAIGYDGTWQQPSSACLGIHRVDPWPTARVGRDDGSKVTLKRRLRRRQAFQVSFDADATSRVAVVAIRHALIESSAIAKDDVNGGSRVRRKRDSQNRGAAQRSADRFSRQIRLTEGSYAKHGDERNERTSSSREMSIAHAGHILARSCDRPAAGFAAARSFGAQGSRHYVCLE